MMNPFYFYISVIVLSIMGAANIIQNGPLQTAPSPQLVEHAIVSKIHDGDTITVTFSKEYTIRLIDCWAPEITGKGKESGLKSKEYLQSILKPGDKIIVEIPMTDKFQDSISLGRILARIWRDVDNDGELDNISEIMVSSGFAKVKK